MQCFQKNPNLRISAKRLLKHPWILSAKRTVSVVPTKPTEYDEAVKSVQEWNEALKSPNNGSLRRASRPLSSSLGPPKKEPPPSLKTPAPRRGGVLHLRQGFERSSVSVPAVCAALRYKQFSGLLQHVPRANLGGTPTVNRGRQGDGQPRGFRASGFDIVDRS